MRTNQGGIKRATRGVRDVACPQGSLEKADCALAGGFAREPRHCSQAHGVALVGHRRTSPSGLRERLSTSRTSRPLDEIADLGGELVERTDPAESDATTSSAWRSRWIHWPRIGPYGTRPSLRQDTAASTDGTAGARRCPSRAGELPTRHALARPLETDARALHLGSVTGARLEAERDRLGVDTLREGPP